MTKRNIYSSFWNDDFVGELTPQEKLLFLYYLTVEGVNSLYCYQQPDRTTMFETGCSKEEIAAFKDKVSAADKMYFFRDYVFLKNANRYDRYTGSLVEKGRASTFSRFPKEVQEWFTQVSGSVPEGVNSTIKEPTSPLDSTLEDPSEEVAQEPTTKLEKSSKFLLNIPEEYLTKWSEEFGLTEEEIKSRGVRYHAQIAAKGYKYQNFRQVMWTWLDRDRERESKPKNGKMSQSVDIGQPLNVESLGTDFL